MSPETSNTESTHAALLPEMCRQGLSCNKACSNPDMLNDKRVNDSKRYAQTDPSRELSLGSNSFGHYF